MRRYAAFGSRPNAASTADGSCAAVATVAPNPGARGGIRTGAIERTNASNRITASRAWRIAVPFHVNPLYTPYGRNRPHLSDEAQDPVRLEFVVRPPLGAGPRPGSGIPNGHCSARHGPPCVRWRRATACGPSTTRGCVPRWRRPDARRHATVSQSWMQRENCEFETHRVFMQQRRRRRQGTIVRAGWRTRSSATSPSLELAFAPGAQPGRGVRSSSAVRSSIG